MIFFHAKRDGTVTTTPQFVPQGSSMQDMTVVSEFDYAFCVIRLTPASGLYIPDIPCTPILQSDGATIWTASLPPEATVTAGSVNYSLIFTAADGTQQGTLEGYFTVPRGAITNMPESVAELESKTISDLYTLLSNIYLYYMGHEGDISKLLSLVTTAGTATVASTAWSGTSALLLTGADTVSNGDLALFFPADEATKTAAEEYRVRLGVAVSDQQLFDIFTFVHGGEAPTVDLTFDYVVIHTDSATAPKAALIGVDAYGSGGGTTSGVDAEAVKEIIKATIPEWAQTEEPPADAVQSVNGQTGAVDLDAEDVGADPAGTAKSFTDTLRSETESKLAEYDKSTVVTNKISAHNTETAAHNDIRLQLQALAERLNALANSDDTTLDDFREVVAYIKNNKTLIDGITSSKVNVTDIINDLVTNDSKVPLSAAQGVALKALIDELTVVVDGKMTEAQVTQAIANALANYPTTTAMQNAISAALAEYAKLTDIPAVLPNPKALVILGKSYDGSAAVAVTVAEIIEAIKTASGGVIAWIGDDNNIYLSGKLAAGTYTAYYEIENEDGTTETVEIGVLTLTEDSESEPTTYTITWVNHDGTVLETDTVIEGETPVYDGVTPTKDADSEYTYTFTGWTPEVVAAVADATYTAVFEQTEVDNTVSYTNLANTTETDWTGWSTDMRLAGSYGYPKSCTGFIMTNYIPAKAGSVLRVKGLNLYGISSDSATQSAVAIYTDKNNTGDSYTEGTRLSNYENYRFTSITLVGSGEGAKEQVSKDDNNVFTYTILLTGDGIQKASSSTQYIRISAPLLNGYTADDVIITIDEEIA